MDPASILLAATEGGQEGVKTAFRLIESLFGRPMKAAGELLVDELRFWQWRNRVRKVLRAKEIIDRDGIAARVIPPSFLLPLLDSMGNVEDETLDEMWSRLLASS